VIDNVTIQNRTNALYDPNTTLSGLTIQNSLLSGNSYGFLDSGTITNLTFLNNTLNKNSTAALSLVNITGLQLSGNNIINNT
jgi:hypothetical protein